MNTESRSVDCQIERYRSVQSPSPVALTRLIPSPEAIACLPESTARRLNVVPLALWKLSNHDRLVVACADPADDTVLGRLSRQLPAGITPLMRSAQVHEIGDALDRCYGGSSAMAQLIDRCQSRASALQAMDEHPTLLISLLEWVLLSASRQGASDIHLSPERSQLHIRFRIDGVLQSFITLSHIVFSGLLVRIKILAAMDIAETRRPQDGQFAQLIDAHDVDFRVSCFPTLAGQNTVIRLLDPQRQLDSLCSLNLPLAIHDALTTLVQRPDGLLLVCGPTGSGKSTTLHALLQERDAARLNIMTLEDPVEQVVAGIRQTSIDAAHCMDYSQGVRALLRQDPDVLLIGEIRDAQSCAMALRAVMTGHQVLTTIHASSSLAGLARLRELGALSTLLADNLVAIASQRLMRKRCQVCSRQSVQRECRHCHQTGYRGRQVIMELLVVTPALAGLIASDASPQALLTCAVHEGFITLQEQGRQLVQQGASSAEELERVLGRTLETHPATTVQGGPMHERGYKN